MKPTTPKLFGQRFRQTRTIYNVTQQKIADESGLNPPTISNIECGRREPMLSTAIKLVAALNTLSGTVLPIEYFVTESANEQL